MEIRTFSRNDWCAFAGAELFSDGQSPLIAEETFESPREFKMEDGTVGTAEGLAVVAGLDGVSVAFFGGTLDCTEVMVQISLENEQRARQEMEKVFVDIKYGDLSRFC